MKVFLYKILVHVLWPLGLFPVRRVRGNRINEFFELVRPYEVSRKLIRLGPSGDGGYLVPNDLDGISACFSPGVSDQSGFELECANRGMKVYMADASVEGPGQKHINFNFVKKFIGANDGNGYLTLDSWVRCSGTSEDSDLLLQMDIEGWEYVSLLATESHTLNRFRIIVVEFHRLQMLFTDSHFQVAYAVFEKLLNSHVCVHIHPNNVGFVLNRKRASIPQAMEFTFYRRDRAEILQPATNFPHPLDCGNRQGTANVELDPCWYRTPV